MNLNNDSRSITKSSRMRPILQVIKTLVVNYSLFFCKGLGSQLFNDKGIYFLIKFTRKI